MNTVKINDREIKVPTSWNALSLSQQLHCLAILQTNYGGLLSAAELKPFQQIKLVQQLLLLDNQFLVDWLADCQHVHGEEDGTEVYLEELRQILQVADFLYERIEPEEADGPVRYQIKLGLTQCPYPYLDDPRPSKQKKNKRWKIKKTRYYAPADALDNLTIYELGITFSLFEKFVQTQEEEVVHELLAILYRRGKAKSRHNRDTAYEGDRRLPYLKHEATVERRKPLMASLPRMVKQLLLFWFASCRQTIIEEYPGVFKQAEGQGGSDWGALLLSLAGGIKDLDRISEQNFGSVFAYLGYLEKQRLKARLNSLATS